MLTTEQLEKLSKWQSLNQQIKELSPQEMALRKEVAAMLVPNATVGTHRFPIAESGYKVAVKIGESIQLDKDVKDRLPTVYSDLVEAGLTHEEAAALIKTEMKLVIGAYNKLSANMQKIMAAVVTTKPSAPTLEIEPPKEGK